MVKKKIAFVPGEDLSQSPKGGSSVKYNRICNISQRTYGTLLKSAKSKPFKAKNLVNIVKDFVPCGAL